MQEISTLLEHWNILGKITDLSDQGYSGSRIYKITDDATSYLLKGYPAQLRLDNILKTHEILNHLKTKGILVVPAPYAATDGSTAIEFESRTWDLVEFFEGKHLDIDPNKEQLSDLVLSVAKLHQATIDIFIDENVRLEKPTNPNKTQEEFDWWDNLPHDKIEHLKQNNLYVDFAEFVELSKSFFNTHLKNFDWETKFTLLPKCITHRDLTKRNVLFSGDKLTVIIDFETTRYGARITDIARLVVEFTEGTQTKIEQIVNVYSNTSAFTDLEKECFITWVIQLNCGVNLWALRHYVDAQILNIEEHSKLVSRIKKANTVYKNLINF